MKMPLAESVHYGTHGGGAENAGAVWCAIARLPEEGSANHVRGIPVKQNVSS
jgi:hypothetical protein